MNFFFKPLIAPTSYPTYSAVTIDPPRSTTNTASSSASVVTTESEIKVIRRKDFCYKYGHKVHNSEGKAPYPLSYDRPILELCGFALPSLKVLLISLTAKLSITSFASTCATPYPLWISRNHQNGCWTSVVG